MRIWRICRLPYATDAFSGEGARRFGGRWNSRGVPMVYSSSSLALAAMELFVHLEPGQAPSDLVSLSAELPEGEPAKTLHEAELPDEWWSDDPIGSTTQEIGDEWIRGATSLAIKVPSVPIRPEWNVLINPLHPLTAKIKIDPPHRFIFDARMFERGERQLIERSVKR
jgi:RES domain-containing protein